MGGRLDELKSRRRCENKKQKLVRLNAMKAKALVNLHNPPKIIIRPVC